MSMNSPNFVAGGDIRPSRFVKLNTSANHEVLEADANDPTIGISSEAGREAPIPAVATILAGKDGDKSMKVYGLADFCLLEAGDTIPGAGVELKSDADGKGIPIATTGTTIQQVGAISLAGGASGELIPVQVFRYVVRPALT